MPSAFGKCVSLKSLCHKKKWIDSERSTLYQRVLSLFALLSWEEEIVCIHHSHIILPQYDHMVRGALSVMEPISQTPLIRTHPAASPRHLETSQHVILFSLVKRTCRRTNTECSYLVLGLGQRFLLKHQSFIWHSLAPDSIFLYNYFISFPSGMLIFKCDFYILFYCW